ncbi:hypothetical protein WA158_005647 [Blastocystis sp. Blastoise]
MSDTKVDNDNEEVKDKITIETMVENMQTDDREVSLHSSDIPKKTRSTRGVTSRAQKNILLMSIGFSLSLLGIKITLNFAVPLLGNLGSICLALLYFGSALVSFVIPICLSWFKDERQTIIILAFEYGIYTLLFSYIIPGLCVFMSIVHGFVAGIFWAAESIYLNANSTDENRGKNAGNFWGVYMLGSVIGNLGAYFLFQAIGNPSGEASSGWNGATSWLFLGLGCISIIGTLPLFFLTQPVYHAEDSRPKIVSLWTRISQVSSLICTAKMALIVPLLWYVGYEYVFVSSMVTRQIPDASSIGLYMAFSNILAAGSSFVVGPLADKVGYSFITLLGTLFEICGLILTYYANINQNGMWYIVVAFFSLSDSCYETVVPIVIGKYFEDQRTANSAFRLLQNLGGGVCYILAPLFKNGDSRGSTQDQLLWELIICGSQSIIVYICYVLFNSVYENKRKLRKTNITPVLIPAHIEGKLPSKIFTDKDIDIITKKYKDINIPKPDDVKHIEINNSKDIKENISNDITDSNNRSEV